MSYFQLLRKGGGLLALALTACSAVPPSNVKANARLSPATSITRALTQLPEPKNKIAVAVYGLRDQTGQYRPSPDSPYSTAVTQGAAAMLVENLVSNRTTTIRLAALPMLLFADSLAKDRRNQKRGKIRYYGRSAQ